MMRKELLLTSDDKPPLLQAQYDHYCEAIIQGVRQDFKSVNATFQRGYVATSEELVDETQLFWTEEGELEALVDPDVQLLIMNDQKVLLFTSG